MDPNELMMAHFEIGKTLWVHKIKGPDSNLFSVAMKIEGEERRVTVDSAASKSLVSINLINKEKLLPCAYEIIAANDMAIDLLGQVTLQISSEGEDWVHTFLVHNQKSPALEILLGNDFHDKFGTDISFRKNQCTIRGKKGDVKLARLEFSGPNGVFALKEIFGNSQDIFEQSFDLTVHSTKETVLEAGKDSKIKIEVGPYKPKTLMHFKPKEIFGGRIMPWEILLYPDEDEISVTNIAPFDITLPKDTKLGSLGAPQGLQYTKDTKGRMPQALVNLLRIDEAPSVKQKKGENSGQIEEEKALNINPALKEDDKQKLNDLLEKYEDVFVRPGNPLQITNILKVRIPLKDPDKVIYQQNYPIPPALDKSTTKLISDLIKEDVLERAPHSNYRIPFMIVEKGRDKNNQMQYRLVLSAKKLNECLATYVGLLLLALVGAATAGRWRPLAENKESAASEIETSVGAVVSVRDQLPYEDALTIAFRYSLPKMLLDNGVRTENDCPPSNYACSWEAQLQALTDMIKFSLRNSTTSQTAGGKASGGVTLLPIRQKRGIWSIAAAAAPLVVEYFPKLMALFGKKKEIRRPEATSIMRYDSLIPAGVNDLPDKILRLQRNYAQFKATWSQQRSRTAERTPDRDFGAEIDGLQVILNGLIELATLDAATARCHENFLPPRLVRMKNLQDAVRRAEIYLAAFSAEPLAPKGDVSVLYRLRAAQCRVEGDKFIVDFHLPIRRAGDALELIDLYPVPFKVRDVSCTFIPDPMTVAIVGNRAAFLPINFCSMDEFFCHIPRDNNPTEVPDCLTGFFPDEEVRTRECNPKCRRSEEPIVTEAADGKFWISTDNEYELTIECPKRKVEVIPETVAGAIVIDLPCACRIAYGSKVLVNEQILCDNKTIVNIESKNVIPVQWTRRAGTTFRAIINRPPTVRLVDILVQEEDKVEVEAQAIEQGVPVWLHEVLAAVAGSVTMALATVCARYCCRRWRRTIDRRGSADADCEATASRALDFVETGREVVRHDMDNETVVGHSRRPRTYHDIRQSVLSLDYD
ncbi:Retrovirus-related Pol polyprotein from transposon 17.6 [Frankliniella fusca]|uniref:Retrovirus-related Pol polyprotein from transposon 17.6 n=1 Tax=Frankliniella fusca TaxID=407009 RepID=A0AAE1HCN6_9NEOP|nr:Retrovirus-related Pol polyprotein from transposon 17.6 [Frankliniella fusca]